RRRLRRLLLPSSPRHYRRPTNRPPPRVSLSTLDCAVIHHFSTTSHSLLLPTCARRCSVPSTLGVDLRRSVISLISVGSPVDSNFSLISVNCCPLFCSPPLRSTIRSNP